MTVHKIYSKFGACRHSNISEMRDMMFNPTVEELLNGQRDGMKEHRVLISHLIKQVRQKLTRTLTHNVRESPSTTSYIQTSLL